VPSKSRAQQRLFQAAEHGADFPMARKIRQSMTHQQMHDFASGSEKGKPQHVERPMHPAMRQRARMVSEAHAHLSSALPHFRSLPKEQRMMMVQHHVDARLGRVK